MTDETDREALAAVLHNNFDAARGRQGVSPIALADAVIAAGWSRGSARVQPTRDEIAKAVNPDAWEDKSPGLPFPDDADAQQRYLAFYVEGVEQRRAPSLAGADRILALFSSAPTVAQVQAETPTMIPLDLVLTAYKDGHEHGWAEEFQDLWADDAAAMDMLATSIQETGIQTPILLGDDGRVWDGHHRLAVASTLGLQMVPVEFAVAARADALDPKEGN